jgi:hypothetical protein
MLTLSKIYAVKTKRPLVNAKVKMKNEKIYSVNILHFYQPVKLHNQSSKTAMIFLKIKSS